MASLIGQSIDRYHILEQLGEGGMASVYKAFDTRLERHVAVKVILPQKRSSEQMLKRFKREARALASLSHPNIVKVLDYGEHSGYPYLVMEYIPGGTLKERMGKPMPWMDANRLLAPMARALDYAHKNHIIHRDIKPSNILITESGEPMLSDFGIAKILESDATTLELTGTGVGIGTPEYMAPEQGLGEAVDNRADIYALGVVLYELITGRKPYHADTPMAVLLKKTTEPLPRPKQFVPDLPEGVENVLIKALARRPQDRYGDMATFEMALESPVTEQLSPATSPGKVVKRAPKGWGKQKRAVIKWIPLIGLGSLVCISLVVGSVVLLTRQLPAIPATATATVSRTPAFTHTPSPTPTVTLTPTPGYGVTWISPRDRMPIVYVPEGEFNMGASASEPGAAQDEKPQHRVYLDAFWIDQTEVTNAMFKQFVEETGYQTDLEKMGYIYTWNGDWVAIPNGSWRTPLGLHTNLNGRENHPVIQVSWNDADAYCTWAGRRLPTEAEWEKAARGTEGGLYPWGNSIPNSLLANYGDIVGDTTPVGSYPDGVSLYGAYDMAGNVYEWVADWYGRDYYSISPDTNPTGPMSGKSKVMRGGSWQLEEQRLLVFVREVSNPIYGNSNLGFRCAADP